MTSLPATIADLIPTQRDLHLEGFDHVNNVEPTLSLRSESVRESGEEGGGKGEDAGREREGGGGRGEQLVSFSDSGTGTSTPPS